MKIELGGDLDNIEVIESTIRNIKLFSTYHGEMAPAPHFQARIKINEQAKESCFDCDLLYYDKNNEFLGLTETHSEKKRSITNEPRVISEPVDIPEGTAKIVARFTEAEDYKKPVWVAIAKILGCSFILIILGSLAVSSLLNIAS